MMEIPKHNLPPSLDKLVSNIIEEIEQKGSMSPLRLKEVLETTSVRIEDLSRFADFDHDVADCYGRKLVFDNGQFEIMIMSWRPGDFSSIHNHGYTEWGAVQVFGPAQHNIFHVKNGVLKFSKREIFERGSIVKVNNALIHQMGNPHAEPFLTLHIYGCNSQEGNITADSRNYDLEFDRISYTCGGAFFDLKETDITKTEPGVEADDDVFTFYACRLLEYYNRQPSSQRMRTMTRRLLRKMESHLVMEPLSN